MMFDPCPGPRLFGMPPGADFPADLAHHILHLSKNAPPEALPRVQILVSTQRMARRLRAIFARKGAGLLPRIGVITDLDHIAPFADVPRPASPLARRLHLARLIKALIDADPAMAPRAALFDLADSLASLLDEVQGEGVRMQDILALDTKDQSGHWQRAQAFLRIVDTYIKDAGAEASGTEGYRAALVDHLQLIWQQTPPKDPIIIAGSTGSRHTTLRLMQLVANLPQGAVVLPGFDFDCSTDIWHRLRSEDQSQDHPQFRYANLFNALECDHTTVQPWPSHAPDPARNALISLSLRPAPVTNQWLIEGPELGDLMSITKTLSLIEAPQTRIEANAIAAAIREAVARKKSAALITPDRTLGRRVAAALSRWDIMPDDSAGRPLSLTAPGRLIRQVAALLGERVENDVLIALLKHPLVRTDMRGPHLLMTRELELFLRRQQASDISAASLARFAETSTDHADWATWVIDLCKTLSATPPDALDQRLAAHIAITEALSAGPNMKGTGELWEAAAGRKSLETLGNIADAADAAPPMDVIDYRRLIDTSLAGENLPNVDDAHPGVMIWGTLEARVQGADVVILGGLNEGTWPERPAPDPWLSRRMRKQLGLLLPDREIGLAAHDYQQAVGASEVILTRSRRDADAETVPARWLNRLINLLGGLPDQNGPDALKAMRRRGALHVARATALDAPTHVDPEPRPAPAPPVARRPKALSVTDIQRLIRDPYAIYAKYVLGLRALNPLKLEPGPAMRGDVFHLIMERFTRETVSKPELFTRSHFDLTVRTTLDETVPWPSVRTLWHSHLTRIAPVILQGEADRRNTGKQIAFEVWGDLDLPQIGHSIHGKADRIDLLEDGTLAIYDYKSGGPPSAKQIRHYDRQLLIEAVMAEAGGFKDVHAAKVTHVGHIGLGRTPSAPVIPLIQTDKLDYRTVTVSSELRELLHKFQSHAKGYTARRAMESVRYDGDYDHLSRFGEWDISDDPRVERLP